MDLKFFVGLHSLTQSANFSPSGINPKFLIIAPSLARSGSYLLYHPPQTLCQYPLAAPKYSQAHSKLRAFLRTVFFSVRRVFLPGA